MRSSSGRGMTSSVDIGDIFSSLVRVRKMSSSFTRTEKRKTPQSERLKIYTQYCINYQKANECVNQCVSDYPAFASFLEVKTFSVWAMSNRSFMDIVMLSTGMLP